MSVALQEVVEVDIEGVGILPSAASYEFSAGAERAVRAGAATLATVLLDESPLKRIVPGARVTVYASDDVLLTGYIRDVATEDDPQRGGSFTVTMVSAAVDFVEVSPDHGTGYVEDADLSGISGEFSPNQKVKVKAELVNHPFHQLRPGESTFRAIEELARSEGVLIHDDEFGAIVLADHPEGTHKGGLIKPGNIERASARVTEQGRYSDVIVRGQSAKGHGAGALRLEARARDKNVTRPRTTIIVHETPSDAKSLKKRAEWQVQRAIGRSRTAQVTVGTWRDADGKLWSPNWLVDFQHEGMGLQQKMVISHIRFTQGVDGTRAELSLLDPRAFGGPNPKGKSETVWKGESPKAEVGTN